MQASKKLFVKASLSMTLVAMFIAAPAAFAKKDLFGNDPAGKQSAQTQNYVPAQQHSSEAAETLSGGEALPAETPPKLKDTSAPKSDPTTDKKEPSYLEKQLARLKSNLVETRNDLFGKKDAKGKPVPRANPAPAHEADSTTSQSQSSESVPVISPTEAAQRAQLVATGQVMNVRKYQDEDKTRYAVKLLQKNGRMKTVTLDAYTGELIEEPTQ